MKKLSILLLLLFSACSIHVSEDSLFHPSRSTFVKRDSLGLGSTFKTNVELPIGQDTNLRGWIINGKSAERIVLYFYSNSEQLTLLRNFLDSLSIVYNAKVISFDMEGYGFSDGMPSLHNMLNDAIKIFDYANDSVSKHKLPIVVWGRSIGTGAALYIAANRSPSATILVSATSRISAVIEQWNSFLPWYEYLFFSVKPDEFLKRFSPQPYELAKHIKDPILLIHGTEDDVIPLKFGRELFDSIPPSTVKRFIELPKKGHYGIYTAAVPVSDSILDFLKSTK